MMIAIIKICYLASLLPNGVSYYFIPEHEIALRRSHLIRVRARCNSKGCLQRSVVACCHNFPSYRFEHIHLIDLVDGEYCLSCGSNKTIKLWNPVKKLHLQTYTGHGLDVMDARCSVDSSQIVSGSQDKT